MFQLTIPSLVPPASLHRPWEQPVMDVWTPSRTPHILHSFFCFFFDHLPSPSQDLGAPFPLNYWGPTSACKCKFLDGVGHLPWASSRPGQVYYPIRCLRGPGWWLKRGKLVVSTVGTCRAQAPSEGHSHSPTTEACFHVELPAWCCQAFYFSGAAGYSDFKV